MAAVWTQAPFDGFAWLVNRRGGSILDSPQRVATMKIHSTAVETINKFSTYVERIVGNPMLQLDIWPLTNLPEVGTGGTAVFDPISDGTMSLGAGAGVPNNTVAQRYQNIDDGAVLNIADYIAIGATSPATGFVTVQPNTSGSPFGGGAHRISAVRLKVDVAGNNDQWLLSPRLAVSGAPDQVVTFPAQNQTLLADQQLVFTATKLDDGTPITEAFIVALAAQTTTYGIQFNAAPTTGTKQMYVRRIRLEVDWSSEFRVVSSVLLSPSAEGWATFSGFTNWAKTAQDYGAVVRCVSGGSCVIPTLDSDAAMPSGHGSYDSEVSGAGVITALGALQTETHPFVMHTTAPAPSVDSQPYVDLRREQVYAGRTIVQELTAVGSGNRGFVRAVVASDNDLVPEADLRVRVKATGTGVQQGGDASFTPEDVAGAPLSLHTLDTTLAALANLTNGTQYDQEWVSSTPADRAWNVVVLDTKAAPQSADTVGFGGTTDRGELAVVEYDDLDIPILLAAVPTAPAGFAAAAVQGDIPYINLTWTPTGLGVSFAAYVIERLHGTKWWPLYRILTEATAAITDYEPMIGLAERYRMRVVKTDGTYSLPSAEATATITAKVNQVGSLTSNRQSSLNRTSELARPLAFEFPREQEVQTNQGARYRTVIHAPYDRGLGLKTKRHVKVTGSSRGFAMFNTLRSLIDANAQNVPYICLRDPFGFRAFVALVSEGGGYEIPTYGSADLQLIETYGVPDLVAV